MNNKYLIYMNNFDLKIDFYGFLNFAVDALLDKTGLKIINKEGGSIPKFIECLKTH